MVLVDIDSDVWKSRKFYSQVLEYCAGDHGLAFNIVTAIHAVLYLSYNNGWCNITDLMENLGTLRDSIRKYGHDRVEDVLTKSLQLLQNIKLFTVIYEQMPLIFAVRKDVISEFKKEYPEAREYGSDK